MIIGIGIDIIEVKRIQALVEKSPRFLERVFTPEELHYCLAKANKYQHLAARFAAKEAFFKALGHKTAWTDVSVANLSSGKPLLRIKGDQTRVFTGSHVSLSHIRDYAVAVVILEKTDDL